MPCLLNFRQILAVGTNYSLKLNVIADRTDSNIGAIGKLPRDTKVQVKRQYLQSNKPLGNQVDNIG